MHRTGYLCLSAIASSHHQAFSFFSTFSEALLGDVDAPIRRDARRIGQKRSNQPFVGGYGFPGTLLARLWLIVMVTKVIMKGMLLLSNELSEESDEETAGSLGTITDSAEVY
jgi:hypothetical protein